MGMATSFTEPQVEHGELHEGPLYSWVTPDGALHTGRVMIGPGEMLGEKIRPVCRLSRESYTGRLVWVEAAALKPYPAKPIPQP